MITPDLLAWVTAEAVTPEQVLPYVCAVAGSRPRLVGSCVGFESEGEFVLVGYPMHDPLDVGAMTDAVNQALQIRGLRRITVIGSVRPPQAPEQSIVTEDCYYALPMPPPRPGQKLRNLLRRAGRELTLDRGCQYGDDHLALVQRYLDERHLATGTRHIFRQLSRYLASSAGSLLLSARLADGRLAAFAVGEFAALRTAFYMFSFREPRLAPPGATDLLLAGLLDEARERGHTQMNLGLGVNAGISFFKGKWGAAPFLPYVQATWETSSAGPFSRLRGLFADESEGFAMKKPSGKASGKAFRGPGFWARVRERLLGVPRLLDCVQVEVSSRCPGRCIYCPHTTMREEWDSRDMDMDTFARLWPLMLRSGRAHLQGWGEPLLNPAFFDMAALARKAGCAVSTTTCGLLMNEEVARKLVEGGFDIVAFSLAGTDAASNASRRGVDFDRVCEAVSTLQAVRRSLNSVHLEVHIAYLMLASNMEAVRRLPRLMHRLGVRGAVISTLDYIPTPDLECEGLAPHETEKLARASAVLRETEEEARRLGVAFHWTLPRPDAPGASCRENIFRCVFVAADGYLSPCVYVNLPGRASDPKRRVFGNVRDQDPLATWEGEEFRRFRNRLASGEPDLPCLTCVKRFES